MRIFKRKNIKRNKDQPDKDKGQHFDIFMTLLPAPGGGEGLLYKVLYAEAPPGGSNLYPLIY